MARTAPDGDFFGLPAGLGRTTAAAWRAFVSDPPRSRRLAEQAFAGASADAAHAWAGLCLAYQQVRSGELAAADRTLARVRSLLRGSPDARAGALAVVVAAYLDVARGESDRAVAALERASIAGAGSNGLRPLDRFLATHAAALAHGRQGRLEQVLHHHYANLLLLDRHPAPAPLAVVLLNLSSTLTAIDDWDEALELARRAVECCATLRNAALRRRAEINVALALRFLGRVDEAIALLERLEAQPFRDPGSDFALHINFAEALAHRGDVVRAATELERARACASASGDTHERANLAWISGLVAARGGDTSAAIERLEAAMREVLALRKLHVPLLPRIVEVLAACYARSGDPARAFATFQQFHETHQARLGYTTRARYTGRQSREGLAAIAGVLGRGESGTHGEHARLAEALRRALTSTGPGAGALPGWSPAAIERVGVEARDLGARARHVGGLVESLRSSPDASSLEGPEQGIRVEVLGDFEVRIGGTPLRFGRKRPERPLALLRYLCLHGVHGTPESRIADALWPDLEGDAALRALAVNLHRLRQLLGGSEAVFHQARRLALDTRHVWCDAIVFEGLLDRAAASGGDEAVRDALLLRAIDVYRGDASVDEDREPWALAPRERLRQRLVSACATHGARLAASGRWEDACDAYARGLAHDALAEELCLGLMRGCLALKRHEAGIAAYRRLEAGLAAAGGRRPTAALGALYGELLAARR